MNSIILRAVYAQVTEAAVPPTKHAKRTRLNLIRATKPSIAPTKTPLAMNGIQTNTINPQNPYLSIRDRFLWATYSTEDRMSPMNGFCNNAPVIPPCRATKAWPEYSSEPCSTRPATARSERVAFSFLALTINSRPSKISPRCRSR